LGLLKLSCFWFIQIFFFFFEDEKKNSSKKKRIKEQCMEGRLVKYRAVFGFTKVELFFVKYLLLILSCF